jgi:hypothetical protein
MGLVNDLDQPSRIGFRVLRRRWMSPRIFQVAWIIAIVIWVLICSAGWYVATRDDYAKLHAARACYSANLQPQDTGSQCANTKPSDILLYKSAIDRKAAVSRVAAGLGAAAALGLWFLLGRPGLGRGPSR